MERPGTAASSTSGAGQSSGRARWAADALLTVARHPGLWTTAAAQALRLARPGWWRRPPFLPLPDREYLRFRLETQYGSFGEPAPEDLVAYLRWCRGFPRHH